ncbi:hypothetical protein MPSEU_000130800 [Mayamaea pseudoterrestris]|nr:hypothetical protein MPSEU_000130800 [Mayamaea pseudoterrestris]
MDQLSSSALTFLQKKLSLLEPLISVETAKSAQQTVLILQLPQSIALSSDNGDWKQALQRGKNRIVVRIWKGSARWWNLNRNGGSSDLKAIARDELMGYRLARLALNDGKDTQRRPYIPHILHESLDNDACHPWAMVEYVGKESLLFQDESFDDAWCESMVFIRREFGFDETHPRWGRVPADQAKRPIDWLQNDNPHRRPRGAEDVYPPIYTFQTMLLLHKQALKQLQTCQCADVTLVNALMKLDRSIMELTTDSSSIESLAPTLVHMDCQPQNILFSKIIINGCNNLKSIVASVLDWEEAAIADPRFELLMLGRKVCANRTQADIIWRTYSQQMQVNLGSIDPWLRLETIHSLTVLLLQCMDESNHSRSPWETKPELVQKIEREVCRLGETSSHHVQE